MTIDYEKSKPPGTNAIKHLQVRFTNFVIQVNFLIKNLATIVAKIDLLIFLSQSTHYF